MSLYRRLLFIMMILLVASRAKAQCDYLDTSPLSIGQVVVTNATCPSAGVIQINNVTGGGGFYVYEIVSGPVIRIVQSQNVFNALPAGSYRVRVSSCNGSIREVTATVSNSYAALYQYGWQTSVTKQSGLLCGATNNGVYKLVKPSYTGGTAPFRIQFASTNNFSGVPYLPGFDSAVFSGLTASTVYYVRVTDACNNFITFDFRTAASTPVVPLSVPGLNFSRAYFYGDCTGLETMYLYFKDSATGGNYDPANTLRTPAIWGSRAVPHIRVRIEDASNGTVFSDRNVTITNSGSSYYAGTDVTNSGQSGLAAPGVGRLFYGVTSGANTMPYIYPNTTLPPYIGLKITLFFPGGDHCGTTIPAYSTSYYYNVSTHWMPQPYITGITSACNSSNNYIRVDYSIPYAGDTIIVVKPGPPYTQIHKSFFSSYGSTFSMVYNNQFNVGESYRVIIKDSCGRTDSMNFVYSPGSTGSAPPPIVDSVSPAFRCPVNPMDTVYSIYIRPLPTGYALTGVTLAGFGTVPLTPVYNFDNTTFTGYKINRLLPPGTYTYTVTWMRNCQVDTVRKTVVITPMGTTPQYQRNLTLTLSTVNATCNTDGYAVINAEGWLRNINTGYNIVRLRLAATPNAFVFPLQDKPGSTLNFVNASITSYMMNASDTIKLYPDYSGLRITPGKEGNYTIAYDIVCPDGTLIETVSRTITVPKLQPASQSFPNMRYANALICDETGSELRINLRPLGGKRPFFYEYKRDTSDTYIPSPNGGTDSIVVIDPAPPAGTVYDLRLTDGCGNTATTRATVSSFTGRFYIYQYPVDCVNNPFDVRVGTSFINGAYYTWKRNGVVIAEGFDIPYVDVTGISVDSITVDINIFNCYTRSASRTIAYTNPCNYTPLPLTKLDFAAFRLSNELVQLNWMTEKEIDLAHFELEKSADGVSYKKVDQLAAFNLNTQKAYSLVDNETGSIVFYRLKIVDKRGGVTYSKVLRVTNKVNNSISLQVSPNPTMKDLSIRYSGERTGACKAKFFNGKGQLVKEVSVAANDLAAGKPMDVSALPVGSYIVSLVDNIETIGSAKFIKQ